MPDFRKRRSRVAFETSYMNEKVSTDQSLSPSPVVQNHHEHYSKCIHGPQARRKDQRCTSDHYLQRDTLVAC